MAKKIKNKKINKMLGIIMIWVRTEIITKDYINPSGSCVLDTLSNAVELRTGKERERW